MKLSHYTYCFQKQAFKIKSYDAETKWMYFLIEHDELLKKYNDIWNEFSSRIEKEFDSKPVYNNKFVKTKIKSYGDETTDFHDKETPKVGSNYTYLAVTWIDFVLKKDKNYYPQVFLKNINTLQKITKVIRYITDELEIFSDVSDEK